MRVLAADPHLTSSSDPQVELTTLEDLLARADVVTLHTRLTAETAHLIDARALARMKRGACLVNTARGELVDEAALIAALSTGALAGAALDTYEHEPLPADSPLRAIAERRAVAARRRPDRRRARACGHRRRAGDPRRIRGAATAPRVQPRGVRRARRALVADFHHVDPGRGEAIHVFSRRPREGGGPVSFCS